MPNPARRAVALAAAIVASAAIAAIACGSEPRTIYDFANDVCSLNFSEEQREELERTGMATTWGEMLDVFKPVKDRVAELNDQDWPDALAAYLRVQTRAFEEFVEIIEGYDRDEVPVFTVTLEDAQMFSRLERIMDSATDNLRSRLSAADNQLLDDAGC